MQDIDLIKVLNRRELVKLLGISERSLQRLEALGDCPPKTRLSEGRVGYRVSDVAAWLDARRETSTARAMIDSNWKTVGAAASKIVDRLR